MTLGKSWMVLGLVLVGSGTAAAEESAAEREAAPEREVPHVDGPRRVDLGNEIELALPAGFVLYERAQARAMLEKGGSDSEDVLGIVVRPGKDWFVVIEYSDIGYTTDTDADQLEPGGLLESYRRGTAEQNLKRRERGIPELFIDGWSETPRYNRSKHQLAWGLKAHAVDGPVINFFTRVLGRGGHLSLDLIDAPAVIEQSKLEAASVLDATRFKPGARYEDHRDGDKSSGMGLRMLILGGAGVAAVKVAKTGLLITILLALKKAIIFIGLAIAGFFKWLFGRKPRQDAAPAPSDGTPDTSIE